MRACREFGRRHAARSCAALRSAGLAGLDECRPSTPASPRTARRRRCRAAEACPGRPRRAARPTRSSSGSCSAPPVTSSPSSAARCATRSSAGPPRTWTSRRPRPRTRPRRSWRAGATRTGTSARSSGPSAPAGSPVAAQRWPTDVVVEVTTYRTDEYDPTSRKPQVAFGDTLEGDLSRRDFTVNSMAVRVPDLTFVDPFDGLDGPRRRACCAPRWTPGSRSTTTRCA